MPQTNAEKAEAIARRKQKDRDRRDRLRHQTLVGKFEGETYQCPYGEHVTWEEVVNAMPMELRGLIGKKTARVIR